MCLSLPAKGYQAVPWLYDIEQPVIAQSVEERERVAGVGLLQVLTRLTGLVSIPRTKFIADALENPAQYYSEFVFFDKSDEFGQKQDYLRVIYQPQAMLDLIRQAELPVWWNHRPNIVAWVVVERDGNRQILDTSSNHELVEALHQQARQRGLDVKLPLMDLTDTVAVAAGDVWGRITTTLEQASVRYDADLVLVGRIRESEDKFGRSGLSQYQGDWQVWEDEMAWVENFSAVDGREVADVGLSSMADRLAASFSVLPRGRKNHEIRVLGIDDSQDYAQMMAFLAGLEFIDAVHVLGIDKQIVSLHLSSHARLKQLVELLTLRGRLLSSDELAIDGASVPFVTTLDWQG